MDQNLPAADGFPKSRSWYHASSRINMPPAGMCTKHTTAHGGEQTSHNTTIYTVIGPQPNLLVVIATDRERIGELFCRYTISCHLLNQM